MTRRRWRSEKCVLDRVENGSNGAHKVADMAGTLRKTLREIKRINITLLLRFFNFSFYTPMASEKMGLVNINVIFRMFLRC